MSFLFHWWDMFSRWRVEFTQIHKQLGVSKNNGTPKSSILMGFSIINHPFWGIPNFGNIQFMVFLTYQPLVITHHSGPEVRKPRILILDEAIGTSHDRKLQKVAFWKGIPFISGKSRLVKYYNLARNLCIWIALSGGYHNIIHHNIIYTLENSHFAPQNGGVWKIIFLFNWVIFRFQPLIFRGYLENYAIW